MALMQRASACMNAALPLYEAEQVLAKARLKAGAASTAAFASIGILLRKPYFA